MNLREKFKNIKIYTDSQGSSLHKPLLIVYAIGKIIRNNERWLSFADINQEVESIFQRFLSSKSNYKNTHYPFGKLENDGLWEIENSEFLQRTSAGHLIKSELHSKNIRAGFASEIFDELVKDKKKAALLAREIAERYFSRDCVTEILDAVGATMNSEYWNGKEVRDSSFQYQSISGTSCEGEERSLDIYSNGYIDYLNSLHNLSANGANALAESQSTNVYFGHLYTPFPCVDVIVEALKEQEDRVIILTGHAGDGKSTVALDVLKQLQGLSADKPLEKTIKDREIIIDDNGSAVNIVKDMSELSAELRHRWLDQAFSEPGSWLIISNTGPLLQSLLEYSEKEGIGLNIESSVLRLLDFSFDNVLNEKNTLCEFSKKLSIINLTQVDNVHLGARIFTKLVNHPAWDRCGGCPVKAACPIAMNRDALNQSLLVVEERVRWIYQLLNSYEQRLTLRQIVSQLAFGITGGINCQTVHQQYGSMTDAENCAVSGLEKILFSEGFFGYENGRPIPGAERIKGISLLRRNTFGGPIGVNFERQLLQDTGCGWGELPSPLKLIESRWKNNIAEAGGIRRRSALRRMVYCFGKIKDDYQDEGLLYLDSFLQSSNLRDFDQWQNDKKLSLTRSEKVRFKNSCLQVLLEFYSGFGAGQFQEKYDRLYLTLRRPDKAVVQPTQLVVGSAFFKDFDLVFDETRNMPLLTFKKGAAKLALTLPLLDYIRSRNAGELDNDLSPVHQSQLEWFKSELLTSTRDEDDETFEVELLRAGIDGEVHIHRFFFEDNKLIVE